MMKYKFNGGVTESSLDRSKTPSHYSALVEGRSVKVRVRLSAKTLQALRELAEVECWDDFRRIAQNTPD